MKRWRKISEWPDYEVSTTGDVRRITRGSGTKPGRFLSPVADANGYLMVSLCRRGTVRRFTIHRLVLVAFRGPPPDGKPCGRHRNGKRHDNMLTNLRWASYAENEADKVRHGTSATGSRNGNAKLKESDVAEIRRMYARVKGDRLRIPNGARATIAAFFGITVGTVHDIVSRRWKHI